MLKILLYQKIMRFANAFLLAVLIAYAVASVGSHAISSAELNAPDLRSRAGEPAIDLPDARVDRRSEYDVILESQLFGAAADGPKQESVVEVTPVVEKPKEAKDTQLPLRLLGTVVAGDTDQRASAIIEVGRGGNSVQTFFIDQAVMDGVYLRDVFDREVILENSSKNRMERLAIQLER